MFDLVYQAWDAAGTKVSEVKRITLDAGQNFSRFESRYTVEGGPRELTHAAGIKNNAGSTTANSKERGTLRAWEPIKAAPGNLGCAVIVDPAQVVDFPQADNNYLVVAKVPAGSPAVYHAGFAWETTGQVPGGVEGFDTFVADTALKLQVAARGGDREVGATWNKQGPAPVEQNGRQGRGMAVASRHASSSQPAMNATPPTGVTAPRRRTPVTASRYRLPENSRIPAASSAAHPPRRRTSPAGQAWATATRPAGRGRARNGRRPPFRRCPSRRRRAGRAARARRTRRASPRRREAAPPGRSNPSSMRGITAILSQRLSRMWHVVVVLG